VFAVHTPREDGLARLPGSHGPLTITPVAISGERGEPVVVDEDDMTADAVYIPGCSVDPDPPAAGLLALTCLVAVRRRRRSS
jgi:MYXO-CTERM domain-containing protein